MTPQQAVNPRGDSVVRDSHVPGRPYLTTGEAARRLGKSLYWVSERVKNGTLEGYGIRAAERTSWYVFTSAVEDIERREGSDARPTVVPALAGAATSVGSALAALDSLKNELLDERDATATVTASLLREIAAWDYTADAGDLLRELKDKLYESQSARELPRNRVDRHLHEAQSHLRELDKLLDD